MAIITPGMYDSGVADFLLTILWGWPIFLVCFVLAFCVALLNLPFTIPDVVKTGKASMGSLLFNAMLIGLDMSIAVLIVRNPLYPRCLIKYPGVALLTFVSCVSHILGIFFAKLRESLTPEQLYDRFRARPIGAVNRRSSVVDPVANGVTVVNRVFYEAVESYAASVVVRKHDYVLFFSPLIMDPETAKDLAEGATRVVICCPNMYHHGAATFYKTLFPDAIITGSQSCATRHNPPLDITHPDNVSLPGCTFVHMDGFGYDEFWLVVDDLVCAVDMMMAGPGKVFLTLPCLTAIHNVVSGFSSSVKGMTWPYVQTMIWDEKALALSLAKVFACHPETLVCCHGGRIENGLEWLRNWYEARKMNEA